MNRLNLFVLNNLLTDSKDFLSTRCALEIGHEEVLLVHAIQMLRVNWVIAQLAAFYVRLALEIPLPSLNHFLLHDGILVQSFHVLSRIQFKLAGLWQWYDEAPAKTEENENSHYAEVQKHGSFSVGILGRSDRVLSSSLLFLQIHLLTARLTQDDGAITSRGDGTFESRLNVRMQIE